MVACEPCQFIHITLVRKDAAIAALIRALHMLATLFVVVRKHALPKPSAVPLPLPLLPVCVFLSAWSSSQISSPPSSSASRVHPVRVSRER